MVQFISTDTVRGLQAIVTACEISLKMCTDVHHVMVLNKIIIEANKELEDVSVSLKTIE